jgi:[ribosomal protein S18]-alanine N-acetyltransferase
MNTTSLSVVERTENLAVPYARWMIRRDLTEILKGEYLSLDPWAEETFLESLRQRNCIGMVAETREEVVAWGVYCLFPSHLHLMKLEGTMQGRMALLEKFRSKLRSGSRKWFSYNCHEEDLSTQQLLAHMGWQTAGVIRECFGSRDGYRFVVFA